MKLLLVFLLAGAAASLALEAKPYGKQNFCQAHRCLTCVGRYCTVTCMGDGCEKCPIGDCCDGTNCNICRGERCCETAECNTCIRSCLQKCIGKSTCHYDCFQECLPISNTTSSNNQGRISSILNYMPVNVTTYINITNAVKNEESFHHPIVINNATIFNFNRKGNPSPTEKCCDIIHPKICYPVPGQVDRKCIIKKSTECSALCASKHMHIVENNLKRHICISVKGQEYPYCGSYELIDCEKCHNCPGMSVMECSAEPNCPGGCADGIIDQQFYNRFFREEE